MNQFPSDEYEWYLVLHSRFSWGNQKSLAESGVPTLARGTNALDLLGVHDVEIDKKVRR